MSLVDGVVLRTAVIEILARWKGKYPWRLWVLDSDKETVFYDMECDATVQWCSNLE